jgi:hypothetical protein
MCFQFAFNGILNWRCGNVVVKLKIAVFLVNFTLLMARHHNPITAVFM